MRRQHQDDWLVQIVSKSLPDPRIKTSPCAPNTVRYRTSAVSSGEGGASQCTIRRGWNLSDMVYPEWY